MKEQMKEEMLSDI